MALHPHQSGNLALSLQDQQQNMQMLLKQQLQAMAHVNAEVRALAEHLGHIGQEAGMVKAAMIGMVGAPPALNYGLRYALASRAGRGPSSLPESLNKAAGDTGGGSPGYTTHEELLTQIREREQVRREERLKTIAIENAVYEQKSKEAEAKRAAQIEADEKRFARMREEGDKRRAAKNREYDERGAKLHQLRMERLAQWEAARSELQKAAHQDLISLHAAAVAQLKKNLGVDENTPTGAPSVGLGGAATTGAAPAATTKAATGESHVEKAVKKVKEELQQKAGVHPMAAAMGKVAAHDVHPIAAAMAGAAAGTMGASGGGGARLPIERLGHAAREEHEAGKKKLRFFRQIMRLKEEEAHEAQRTDPSRGGVARRTPSPLFRWQRPIPKGEGWKPPPGSGTPAAGTPEGGDKGRKKWDDFEHWMEKTTRSFIALTTAAQSLIQQASPDVWDTLTGSITLLVGQLGQALIPQVLKLSEWLQNAAQKVEGWSDTTKDWIGYLAAGAAALTGLAVVIRVGKTIFETLWPILKFFGKSLKTLGMSMIGMRNPLIAALTAVAASFAFKDEINEWAEKNLPFGVKHDAEKMHQRQRETIQAEDTEVKAIPQIKEALEKYKSNPAKAAEEIMKHANVARQQRMEATQQFHKLYPDEQPSEWWDKNPNNFWHGRKDKEAIAIAVRVRNLNKIYNSFIRGAQIASNRAGGRPDDLGALDKRAPAELTAEGKQAKMNLLLAMRSFRANPVYSSVEEQYKKTQITALGKDPIEQAIDRLRMESMEKVISLLNKADKNDQEILNYWKTIKLGRQ